MGIDLYVVHGSHPCAAVERALELKGLAYRRVELPPPLHAPIQKLRFGTRTVPGMRLPDGEKVVGSSAILRRLDDLAPEPPLFPPDGEARALVQRAEEWGEEVYQPIARRLLWAALRRAPDALPSYAHGSRLPLPAAAIRAMAPAVTRVEATMNRAVEGAVRADLRALPRHLDRIDGWLDRGVIGTSPPNAADLQIAAGVTGTSPPNAADLQIAATSRLLLTVGDVAPFLAGRPVEAHAHTVFPAPQPGSTPRGVFPPDWLAGSPPRRRGA
ncbi:MAG: glutathione S-transferase [Solirubrobacteraceae bacterium]|nr:glutathione S-transferase [Solirubrobacteraceae bacterium]